MRRSRVPTHWKADATAEASLRAALVPTLGIVGPTVLLAGLAWTQIDRPAAPLAGLALIVGGIALGALAVHWHRQPPGSVHFAGAMVIGLLYLCSMAQLLAFPDPVLGSLHMIVAIGTALFLIDLRWMVAVQLFGAVTWLVPVSLAPPSPQWALQGYVVLIGLAAALAFRKGRLHSMRRIRELTDESQLKERESSSANVELRHAQRIAKVGSFEWNPETDELHWSDEHYRIFGWAPGEAVSAKRFFEAIDPDDRAPMAEAFADSLEGGKPVDLEFRIRRADGEQRVVHGRGETVFDASGRPILHRGTSHDITAQHRAAEELHASQDRLMAILTAMDAERAVVVSRDGIVRSILGEPPRGRGRYRVKPTDVEGRPVRDFLPGEDGDRVLEAVNQVYATGERGEVEATVEFPGGVFHFDVSLRALRSSTGEIESVLAIVRDMTQRKADAQALRQAQKLESLGILAGGIAHDFNNLLVGILGNSETALEETDEDSPIRSRLEDVLEASERAADLTEQLLAYAGEAKFSTAATDLATLVAEMTELFHASVAGRGRIEVESGPEPVWIDADASQIRQVVMNFIINASEALRGDSGRVTVRTGVVHADRAYLERCHIRDDLDEGEFALLEVSDDGIGMDRETTKRIFDPFFTTKFQGRGLGLAATLGIVRSHKGAIHVDSRPGRGTTIRVLLPLVPPGEVGQRERAPIPRPGGGRILVVDDLDTVRKAARRMLEARGYDVVEAFSGSEAVDFLKAQEGDVAAVLLDLTMPEMDGEQTLEALRAIRPDLPVVFMSGHSHEELARRIEGKSRTGFVRKPFRISELSGAIHSLLADPG